MNKQYRFGFTLIELLIVIVIIGALAAIAIPRFSGHKDEAHDAVFVSAQNTLLKNMEHAKLISVKNPNNEVDLKTQANDEICISFSNSGNIKGLCDGSCSGTCNDTAPDTALCKKFFQAKMNLEAADIEEGTCNGSAQWCVRDCTNGNCPSTNSNSNTDTNMCILIHNFS